MPLNLPSAYPGNPSGYVTYYKAQADNYAMSAVYARNPLETTTVLDWEMSSMLANCSRSIATKVYVADAGNWSTAANWFPAGVPAAGDNVLIGEGVSVTYDVDSPTTSLSFVRLDGTLYHPHNVSTAINVNTIFVTPTGKHQIGTESTPLSASRTCRIIFSSSTDMDVSVDTALQTKGIVSSGTRAYFGASKTFRLKVASNTGPAAGDTQIILEAQPSGWAVGDRITICGTQNKIKYSERQEEVRTITGIGLTGTVSLNSALTYGHTAPSSTLVATNTLRAYVANLTRNIKFSTENGTTCLRHRRAHDMQMHYPTYRAQWVEWRDMGRTDKRYGQGAVWTVPDGTPRGGTAAGIMPCNGPTAVSGVVTFDTPSRIAISNYRSPDQNFTIYGTLESGTATTEIIYSVPGKGDTFFKTVTGWSCPIATVASIDQNSVSRLMTSSGVRNTNGSTISTNWTYSTPTVASNVQGRYPVHFHKCGIESDVFTTPIQMLGCVVTKTPGWSYAHHLSHVNMVRCIAHDSGGAGFVAEAGNETGLWRECHSTLTGGHNDFSFKDDFDTHNFDPGRNSAYWFTGRMVKVVGCVGTDTEGVYVYNVRFLQTRLTTSQTDHPRMLYGAPNPTIDEAPIAHFDGNESIAAHVGFIVIKAQQFQGHDVRTMITNHKSWSCTEGYHVEYTQHYTYRNLIGVKGTTQFYNYAIIGFRLGPNTSDQVWVNTKLDGYEVGFGLNHYSAGGVLVDFPENGFVFVNNQIVNCDTQYTDYQSTLDVAIASELSLTATASLSLSLTTNGTRRWASYGTYWNNDNQTLGGPFNGWQLRGQHYDSLYGQVPVGLTTYPKGIAGGGQRDYSRMIGGGGIYTWDFEFIKRYGLFQDSVLGYTMHMPAYYSDRVTGVLDMKMIPATMPSANYATIQGWAPLYVRGTADYTKTEKPVINAHRVSTAQNVNTNVNLLQGATHSLSISMYVAGVDKPFNCHVVDNNNGTITIVPPVNYTGTETFSYWVADNNANVTRGQVIVEVNQTAGTGRAGVNDFIATQYNTATSVNVLANDIGDSKVLQTAIVVGGSAVGTASISTGGVIVFTPTSTFAVTVTQTAEIQYTFTASGGSAGASLFVTVNAAPATGVSGTPDFAATPYNTPVALNVLANDIGDNKVALTATVVGGNAVGTATFAGNQLTFTPTNTFASVATQTATVNYTFTASGGSAGAAWLITVNPPPATGRAGLADFNSTTYNVAVSTNVLANDIGDNKVLQTAIVVGGAAVGTASISTGGIIVFTPTSTYATVATQTAEVQYTFTASGGSAGASLFITVNPPPPTGRAGVADFNSTTWNAAVSTNVLTNDIGDSKVLLTATVVGGNSVGTASISTGGIIVFTPSSTFARTVTQVAEIQYTFTASGGSAGASLFVTVNAGPPLPVAVADFTSTTYNQAVSFNVLANDTGGESKSLLTATVVGGNSVGTASISTGGVIVFTPSTTFATTLTQVAEIQYTFTATGGSAAGSLFVTVNAGPSQPPPPPTPTAPIATNGTAGAYVGRQNGILILRQAYDTNPGGFILLVAASRIDGVSGTVDFDPSGILYVTPNAEGTMRVNYRVRNGNDLSAEAEYLIRCANPPRAGGSDGGSAPMIGAPVSWSRKNVSNIKSVAKAISAVFADLDPNDPIRLAERMVRKYTYAEIKKLIGTSDFESLLDMELQELVDEMERMKNGD